MGPYRFSIEKIFRLTHFAASDHDIAALTDATARCITAGFIVGKRWADRQKEKATPV
jgi:hypothetical protein